MGKPLFDFPDAELRDLHKIGLLRETLQCQKCGATNRDRTLSHGILSEFYIRTGILHNSIYALSRLGLQGITIFDSDAFSPISRQLKGLTGYTCSSYFPGRDFGDLLGPGHYNIDIQKIDFENNSFDIILSSDMMEHVRDIDAAHEEIFRILAVGGVYLFNVPYDSSLDLNRILVDTSGEVDIFIEQPHYHGDPLTGAILAYRIFGKQIFKDISNIGFCLDFELINNAQNLIVNGDLFRAVKKIN
ncbi:MAG: methyltransferase domain-containing protein [Burkholderiales bacterium]|jgi:SAM-dependent methyltransferase|nr:methyltransferase domain-containing protein [Burkholderiales bacterium]